MIRRARLRASLFLAVAVLALTLGAGSLVASPSAALADSPASYTVSLNVNGSERVVTTQAQTVAALLQQRHIVVRASDYLYPTLDVPLSDGLTIAYRAAVPVTIVVGRRKHRVVSSAQSVADLLDEEQISLGTDDVVKPSLESTFRSGSVVRVVRIVTWTHRTVSRVPHATLYRLDLAHPMGRARVATSGRDGVRVKLVTFTRRNGGPVEKRVTMYLERAPRERIVDDGLSNYHLVARSRVRMIATAYTPYCSGCSGRTAIGLRAGPGIVAVDPAVIPLGSRLYIPGYGFALAGDTGGAIHGDRVDLGFASYSAAIRFGRREVTVYTLK